MEEQEYDQEEDGCEYILQRGKNAGKHCGKPTLTEDDVEYPVCRKHKDKYMRDIEENIQNIPNMILIIDVSQITNREVENPIPDFDKIPKDIDIKKYCPVCDPNDNDPQSDKFILLGCRHSICYDCLTKLDERICPECRHPVDMSLIKVV